MRHGATQGQVARELGLTIQTVGKWRKRFVHYRIEGLSDTPRPNVHRKLSDERVEEVVRLTTQTKPDGCTHGDLHPPRHYQPVRSARRGDR